MDQAVTTPIDTSDVVELRQYTLHPRRRDTLMSLFEEKFVAPQQALGIHLHGEFRDARDPDRFVWLRGYRDMAQRPAALESFYGGPAWKENRDVANATMVDSDNVLLLRPVGGEGFSLAKKMTSFMVATIYLLQAPVDATFLRFFESRVRPAVTAAGAPPVAELQSAEVANNFPKLPVREGEHAFVWFAGFDSEAAYRRHVARLAESKEWRAVTAELAPRLKAPATHLELVPTAGSMRRNAERYVYSMDHTGDVHDFDFIEGSWTLTNRRLEKRGQGSSDWDYFPAQSRGHVLMGGIVNVDELSFPTKGWAGVTVRTFDMAKRQWSIYWVSSRAGKITPPQVGGFEGNVGLFFGEDDDGGRPVKVVYKWTKLGPNAARWEQAFSYDGGSTWETNWVNELTRVTNDVR